VNAIVLGGNRWLWLAAAGLLVLLALSPWFALDLAAIAGLGLLFLIRPDLSLPLIAASIPFWPRPEHLLRWEFSLFEILVWLAVACVLSRWAVDYLWGRFRLQAGRSRSIDPHAGPATGVNIPSQGPGAHGSGRRTLHIHDLDWPVLGVLALGLVSALFAQHGDVALREYRTVFLGAVLFYWLITRSPAPAADSGGSFSPWPLLNGLLAGAVIVSLVAIWQLATGQGRVDVEGVWRVRAFYGSPNNLALVVDRVIPLALAVAAFGGGVGRSPAGRALGAKALRGMYGLAAVVMLVACTATFSKGALLLGLPIGVGLVLTLGAWRAQRRWPLGLLAGLAGVGIAGLIWLARTRRFADLLNFRAGTSFFRLKLWQGAWHMALDHPWLGVGPDNFLYAYRTRYVLPSAWQELNLSHPHNIVLDLWTRLGIPGLVVGIWAIWAGVRSAWALLRGPDEGEWPIALGLLGGLAVTVAHGLIDNSLFLVDLMAIFMLTLGLLQRLTEREARSSKLEARS
jgi:O-antigen ligase